MLFKTINSIINNFGYEIIFRKKSIEILSSLEKQQLIKKISRHYKINTLVETGTYLGETVNYLKKDFKEIYSIELDQTLYQFNKLRFKKDKNIIIYQGNSQTILPKIMKMLKKPTIFWLDAHYSGGVTARSKFDSPIIDELKIIFKHKIKNHVLLIDDARDFNGKKGYLVTKEIEKLAKENKYDFLLKDDIMRLTPQL